MVKYDAFEIAKEWLYREFRLGAKNIDTKKLNSLICLLDEVYSYGVEDGYNNGYNDGLYDGKNFKGVL